MTLAQTFSRVIGGSPLAAIPDIDVSRAVLPGRNVALEVCVVERVIFDVNREPALAHFLARSFGHRPTFQDTIELQPKIVMKLARLVPLDHVAKRALAAFDVPA